MPPPRTTTLRTTVLIDAPLTTVKAVADRLGPSSVPLPGGAQPVRMALAATGAGTLLTCTVSWRRFGEVLDALLWRRRVLARLTAVAERVHRQVRRLPVVVAAVIIRSGAVLAQQRAYPAADAGRWELPGGRVEAGESESAAVVREIREELAVDVRAGERVGPEIPLPSGPLLRAYAAELAGGEPVVQEHQAVRWVAAGDLDTLDWLPADRALLPAVRAQLC
ncbi:MAG: (deoxy)nucleoside triphosphate pyrophosphohydrolase [Sciscionella sp.]